MKKNKLLQRIFEGLKQAQFFQTLKHTSNYFGANMATKALGFISLPILTRLLSTSDYGIINIFTSYIGIIIVLATFSSHTAIGRYYYEKDRKLNTFVGTSIILTSFFIFLSFSGLIILKEQFISITSLPSSTFIYIFPLVIFEVINSIFTQIYQAQRKSKSIALLNILKTYIGFGLTILIILSLNAEKYLGQIISNTIVGFLSSIYILYKIKRYIKIDFLVKNVNYIFKYSIPLIPYYLSGIILAQFDRIMIGSTIGSKEAGLYSLAYNIGMLLAVFSSSINSAFFPNYYKYMNSQNYSAHDKEVDKLFRLICVAAIGLIYFGQEIGMLLSDKSFHEALPLVPIVVIGYLFYSIFVLYNRNIDYVKKTFFASVIVILSGVLNIVLNSIFIPRYGYFAGAYTTAISYLFMGIITWIVSKYIIKTYSFPIIKVLKSLSLFTVFAVIFFVFRNLEMNLVLLILVKLILISILIFLLFRDVLKQLRKQI